MVIQIYADRQDEDVQVSAAEVLVDLLPDRVILMVRMCSLSVGYL